jgi:hypothetical protein
VELPTEFRSYNAHDHATPSQENGVHTQDASYILSSGIASPVQLRSVALDTQTCASNGDSGVRSMLGIAQFALPTLGGVGLMRGPCCVVSGKGAE